MNLRALPLFQHRDESLRSLQFLSLIGLLLALFIPSHGFGFSICFFQNTIGWPCPGCGLTRSVASALRFQFWTAFYYNPLGIPIALFMLYLALSAFLKPLTDVYLRYGKAMVWGINIGLLLILLFGILRIVALSYFPDIFAEFAVVNSERSLFPALRALFRGN